MPASPHHQASPDAVVHHPAAVGAAQAGECRWGHQSRARSSQEIIVELAPADAIAHRLVVIGIERRSADPAGSKSGNRLQHTAAPIFIGVDRKFAEYLRRDPSSAYFIARKGLPV